MTEIHKIPDAYLMAAYETAMGRTWRRYTMLQLSENTQADTLTIEIIREMERRTAPETLFGTEPCRVIMPTVRQMGRTLALETEILNMPIPTGVIVRNLGDLIDD